MVNHPSINTLQLAVLSNLSISAAEAAILQEQFQSTLQVVSNLNDVNTSGVEATPQVTTLTNRFREDVVNVKRCLSQQEALLNAAKTYQGFFVVAAVLDTST